MEFILGCIFLSIISALFSGAENKRSSNKCSSNTFTNNKNTSGFKQGKTWDDIKERAYKKYGRKCFLCNSTNNLNIHHKIPIREGGTNEIGNLIPLCVNCHEKIHKFKFQFLHTDIPDNYGFKIDKNKKLKKGYLILNAIKNKYRLLIQYKYRNGNITVRIILPVSIKLGCEINDSLFQKKVYVNALCELREEERIFRLDRIKILSLLKRDNI